MAATKKPAPAQPMPRTRNAKTAPAPARPRRTWVRVVKWLVLIGFTGMVAAVAALALVFWHYGRGLPNIDKIGDYHPKQVTTIVDANDRRVGELFEERRTYVPFDKVPPIVVDAFVAAEDNKFWTHGGVDYFGMLRAFVANLRAGHTKQGASTITQQVVKTFLLTPERTFKRKIEEIILARRLEHELTKQEIITLYMNQIYFGHGRYGIQEASRYFFGKDVSQLNPGEAAMLASMPKEPEMLARALFDTKHPERAQLAKSRQIYVLNQLVAMAKISPAEAQKWIDAPIKIVDPDNNPYVVSGHSASPEWVDLAHKELNATLDDAALGTLGGTVRTTLDPSLQATAQKALQAGLRAVDRRHHVGLPIRKVKADKVDAEIARLAKKLPAGGPVAKETYDAVITAVHDDDHELSVDLGSWPAAIVLGGPDDARFNPPNDDGTLKKPSERFVVGDVIAVVLAPQPKVAITPAAVASAAAAEEADPAAHAAPEPIAKHAAHRVVFEPGPEGAVVIMDVKTRKVRALVGGYASRVGGFDRATMAHRQAGSSFKPFVYATAFDQGKATPARVVNDAPEVFELWRPKNFETTFEGPVRLRTALAKSINTVAIRVAYEVGPENIAAMANKLGVKSELPKELSIALGAGGVTPLEMTNGFASLADGGVYLPPRFVDAIDGKPVPATAGQQVLRPEVAYVTTDMMRSVVTEGTAAAASKLKIPIAGKTGTSNDAKDTWFIGATPDIVVGVWIGYDDNRPVAHEQGAATALPVFIDIMRTIDAPAKAFPRPAHVVEAIIDKASGLLAPPDAPKGTSMTEVFVEGTAPTEVAAQPGEVTETNMVTDEYKEQ